MKSPTAARRGTFSLTLRAISRLSTPRPALNAKGGEPLVIFAGRPWRGKHSGKMPPVAILADLELALDGLLGKPSLTLECYSSLVM